MASAPVIDEPESGTSAFHDKTLRRFDVIAEATQEERALALQDRRFAFIAGAQWEDEWADQFENSIMVEINKTAAGLEKIINDYREIIRRNVFAVESKITFCTTPKIFFDDFYAIR